MITTPQVPPVNTMDCRIQHRSLVTAENLSLNRGNSFWRTSQFWY